MRIRDGAARERESMREHASARARERGGEAGSGWRWRRSTRPRGRRPRDARYGQLPYCTANFAVRAPPLAKVFFYTGWTPSTYAGTPENSSRDVRQHVASKCSLLVEVDVQISEAGGVRLELIDMLGPTGCLRTPPPFGARRKTRYGFAELDIFQWHVFDIIPPRSQSRCGLQFATRSDTGPDSTACMLSTRRGWRRAWRALRVSQSRHRVQGCGV